jgi:hypothetical protein
METILEPIPDTVQPHTSIDSLMKEFGEDIKFNDKDDIVRLLLSDQNNQAEIELFVTDHPGQEYLYIQAMIQATMQRIQKNIQTNWSLWTLSLFMECVNLLNTLPVHVHVNMTTEIWALEALLALHQKLPVQPRFQPRLVRCMKELAAKLDKLNQAKSNAVARAKFSFLGKTKDDLKVWQDNYHLHTNVIPEFKQNLEQEIYDEFKNPFDSYYLDNFLDNFDFDMQEPEPEPQGSNQGSKFCIYIDPEPPKRPKHRPPKRLPPKRLPRNTKRQKIETPWNGEEFTDSLEIWGKLDTQNTTRLFKKMQQELEYDNGVVHIDPKPSVEFPLGKYQYRTDEGLTEWKQIIRVEALTTKYGDNQRRIYDCVVSLKYPWTSRTSDLSKIPINFWDIRIGNQAENKYKIKKLHQDYWRIKHASSSSSSSSSTKLRF